MSHAVNKTVRRTSVVLAYSAFTPSFLQQHPHFLRGSLPALKCGPRKEPLGLRLNQSLPEASDRSGSGHVPQTHSMVLAETAGKEKPSFLTELWEISLRVSNTHPATRGVSQTERLQHRGKQDRKLKNTRGGLCRTLLSPWNQPCLSQSGLQLRGPINSCLPLLLLVWGGLPLLRPRSCDSYT